MKKIENTCPFCGCLSTQVLQPPSSTHGKGYQIECINCGARGPCGMATPEDACLAWDKGDPPYERPFLGKNAWAVSTTKFLFPELPIGECDFRYFISCQFCGNSNVYSKGCNVTENPPYAIYSIDQSCEYCATSWELNFEYGKGATYIYLSNVQEPQLQPTGSVYFIEAVGTHRIKIGFSANPSQRLRSLQTGSPYKLRILATIQANEHTEKEIHEQFDEYRLDGEWFHACKGLRTFISSLENKSNLQ